MMKYILLLTIFFASFTSIKSAEAQAPDSCLKLWCKDWEELAEYTICRNPDSVLTDSCDASPTYLQFYANRWFELTFEKDYFKLPAYPREAIVEVQWEDIPAGSARDAIQAIAAEFGEVILQKTYPDITDSTNLAIRRYRFRYQVYAAVDSIVDRLAAGGIEAHFRSSPAIMLSVDRSQREVTSVWPNPTNQLLYLDSDKLPQSSFTIFDLSGAAHHPSVSREGPRWTIDVSALASGRYLLVDALGQGYPFIRE